MNSAEIRASFLEYFKSRGHSVVASSPLVPANDPTLLFVNSGMVQFKDVFLGNEKRAYLRATTSQRCVRAGGKHNDLENVGYTARHHTFFEMLGNFSFGDYFKKDAIRFAWELLTVVYKLPPERLWVTVYETDDEAYELWTGTVGVPAARVVRIGDKPGGARFQSDNFWQMADTGPCGPCSEIFYDHGPGIPGGPPGSPDADADRFIEIWNLVFMQFNRDDAGVMHPLPKPSVDTGMGLERIAAVLQHVHSNYEIDLFRDLIKAAARETGQRELRNPSLNVIADHIRACAFLIVDGVIPGNEGRGYVLRRIVRRAIRHGYKLGQKRPFFFRLVADLDQAMGAAYPELRAAAQRVADVLRQEEERFAETLEHGMGVLTGALASGEKLLDGETIFKLYDTFGFPVDLTADICRERGVSLDLAGFEAAMTQQRARLLGRQDRIPRLRHVEYELPRRRAVPGRRAGGGAGERRNRHGGAGPDAVLRRVGWPGRRPGRARGRHRHLRGRRYAEDPGRGVRPPRRAENRVAQGRRQPRGARGRRAARADHAQSLGDAPDAQGAARRARSARAAERLAGRRRPDALRFRPRQADER
jgi:alanyl-tRNA synthetase